MGTDPDRIGQYIGMALIDPGKPWQSGVTESFNRKFRVECLSLEWYRSRLEAKVIIEAWRRHYNEVRPHSSLDYLTPNEFAARATSTAPRQATGPSGTKAAREGSRLKLTVVRKTRAGHCLRRPRRIVHQDFQYSGLAWSRSGSPNSSRKPRLIRANALRHLQRCTGWLPDRSRSCSTAAKSSWNNVLRGQKSQFESCRGAKFRELRHQMN
jgi:putative transposase